MNKETYMNYFLKTRRNNHLFMTFPLVAKFSNSYIKKLDSKTIDILKEDYNYTKINKKDAIKLVNNYLKEEDESEYNIFNKLIKSKSITFKKDILSSLSNIEEDKVSSIIKEDNTINMCVSLIIEFTHILVEKKIYKDLKSNYLTSEVFINSLSYLHALLFLDSLDNTRYQHDANNIKLSLLKDNLIGSISIESDSIDYANIKAEDIEDTKLVKRFKDMNALNELINNSPEGIKIDSSVINLWSLVVAITIYNKKIDFFTYYHQILIDKELSSNSIYNLSNNNLDIAINFTNDLINKVC